MKTVEFRNMTNEELNAKLVELKQELFNLRFSHATGQLSNPMQLNVTKKDIAKVKTILKQREISAKANETKA
jgi:large subunit ribosomal protein L29